MSIFGTDGIRGKVGQFPIDPESMVRLGHWKRHTVVRLFARVGFRSWFDSLWC
jgi:hypothetical protein